MKLINQLIAFLYQTNKISMKYSPNNWRVFFAKIVFSLLLLIWLYVMVGLFEVLTKKEFDTSYILKYGKLGTTLLLLFIYFFVNLLTWNTEKLENYISDTTNTQALIWAKKMMIFLFFSGFIIAMSIAIIKKGGI